jgi:hypothetical protein
MRMYMLCQLPNRFGSSAPLTSVLIYLENRIQQNSVLMTHIATLYK